MASRKPEFSTRIEAAAGSLLSLTTDGHHWLARSSRATDPCFVFLEQLNVSPSHGRIHDVPIAICRHEEMLDHHLRRIDQAVMQSRKLTRPESTCPMRFLQLTS
jgi:hypothetical protein